jgi:hypothetical protein
MTSVLLPVLYTRSQIFSCASSSQLSLTVALPAFNISNDDGGARDNNSLKAMTRLQGLTCY